MKKSSTYLTTSVSVNYVPFKQVSNYVKRALPNTTLASSSHTIELSKLLKDKKRFIHINN